MLAGGLPGQRGLRRLRGLRGLRGLFWLRQRLVRSVLLTQIVASRAKTQVRSVRTSNLKVARVTVAVKDVMELSTLTSAGSNRH